MRFVDGLVHPTERRLRAPWRAAVLTLVLVVCAIAAAFLPFDLVVAWNVQLAAFAVATLAAGRFVDRRRRWLRTLGADRRAPLELVGGTILGGALVAGIAGLEVVLGVSSIAPVSTPIDLAALAVGLVLFALVALSEELLFRAYLLTNLAEALTRDPARRGRAVVLALVLSALIFGSAHALNPNATVVAVANVAVAGVLLGLPFVTTGRLGVGVGVHFGWNTMQSLLDMPVSGQRVGVPFVERTGHGDAWLGGGAFGPEAGVLGLGAILLGVFVLTLATRLRTGVVGVATGLGVPPQPASPGSGQTTLPGEPT